MTDIPLMGGGPVTMYFSRVGEQCQQSGFELFVISWLVAVDGKISNIFDISPTLPDCVCGPRPPGSCPNTGFYSLSDTLPVMSYCKYLDWKNFPACRG